MTPAPLSYSPEPDAPPAYSKRSPSPSPTNLGGPPSTNFGGGPPAPPPFQAEEDDFQPGPAPRREGVVSPPLPANGGARVARTPPALAGMAVRPEQPVELPPEQPPLSQRDGPGVGTDHPLNGVNNVEDLGQPEALHANYQKEADILVDLFGDYVTRCVYSKSWNLRDAALQKLTLDLQAGVHSGTDPTRLLAGYVQVLKRMVADKTVQVFLSGAALLQAVCAQLLGKGSQLRRQEVHSALDPLLPLLVERLGDSNTRVDKTARDAHMDFARSANVGAAFTGQHLLRPPKKKSVNPRVFVSRLQLLSSLVAEAGIQPESKEGLPLEPTVQLAMEWFSNANAEVRESAVKLVAACYAHAGLNRIEKYLANLRPSQRELFDAEFEGVNSGDGLGAGSGDGLGNLPTPQVPPRRVASNRSSPKGAKQLSPGFVEEEEADAQEDVTTCQFCGLHNPKFTPEAMDVHYWRECPMLTQCQFCQQVIEISTLVTHLREECEAGEKARQAAKEKSPSSCPLCNTGLGGKEDRHWRDHLLVQGCAGNPRDQFRQGLLQQQQEQAA